MLSGCCPNFHSIWHNSRWGTSVLLIFSEASVCSEDTSCMVVSYYHCSYWKCCSETVSHDADSIASHIFILLHSIKQPYCLGGGTFRVTLLFDAIWWNYYICVFKRLLILMFLVKHFLFHWVKYLGKHENYIRIIVVHHLHVWQCPCEGVVKAPKKWCLYAHNRGVWRKCVCVLQGGVVCVTGRGCLSNPWWQLTDTAFLASDFFFLSEWNMLPNYALIKLNLFSENLLVLPHF